MKMKKAKVAKKEVMKANPKKVRKGMAKAPAKGKKGC